jgi:acyl-CoA thioesterase-1
MIHRWCEVRRALLARAARVVALVACGAPIATAAQSAAQRGSPSSQDKAPVILVLGDSLSAEYGLVRDRGWVRLLEQRLAEQRITAEGRSQYSVVNASISGETTSGGRTRLPALLKNHRPAVVIIELGANDGLRGLSLDSMRANLRAMVVASQQAGARVLLVGMRIPPNYGRAYTERFHASFADLSRELKTGLAPFLLDGIAEDLSMFQPDRIHPNEKAQPKLLDNVWPHLLPLLRR